MEDYGSYTRHTHHGFTTTVLPYAPHRGEHGVEHAKLQLTETAPCGSCLRCGVSSSAVHSRYQRHLTDLPWGPLAVRLQLLVRKFVCRQPSCTHRILTQRLPEFVAAYARKTMRLITALQAIGIALGGAAGARLAVRLRPPPSPATLLRLVRAALVPQTPALQAIGVDEWAWRRGHRYGTILVDLATHRVVDLLPDRSAATIAAWLAEHPTITVVCRDRSDLSADGIRRGVPEAVRVVDRFHLVHNLHQVVEAFLVNHRPALQAAAALTAMALTPADHPIPVTSMYRGRRQRSTKGQLRAEAARQHRHVPWVAIYDTLHMLHAQGTPIATITRQLGISRLTVYAYLRRDTPPGLKRPHWRPSAQVLTPYIPYLLRRWRERGADSRLLWREMQSLAIRTRPGRSAASSPSCGARAKPDWLQRRRPRRTPVRRGRPPARCRSPWCALPGSGRRMRRSMSSISARWKRTSRGRMR